MHSKTNSPPLPVELQKVLDWLAEPKPGDPLLDLVPLRNHIAAIGSLGLPLVSRIEINELLQQRADGIDQVLTPMLLDVKLPLPNDLGTIAQGLINLRAELGAAWLKIARDTEPRELTQIHCSRSQICLRGILNLSRQLVAGLLIASPTSRNFWRNAQALYHLARETVDPTATLPAEISEIDAEFKAMLALTVAQPEGLAPREIAFLAHYLRTHAAVTRIDMIRPENAGDWFWLDPNRDRPPVSLSRRRPDGEPCLYFCFGALGNLVARHLNQLNEDVLPVSLGLPPQVAGVDYRNALERARQCWIAPRRRNFNRRSQAIRVQVCTELSTLWTELETHSSGTPTSDDRELNYSEWTLLNDSPSGYAIVHFGSKLNGISPGCALGFRAVEGAPWQICLVRWARSKNSTHIELGLEVLAPSAKPIWLQAMTSSNPEPPVTALLLPALPGIHRGEAILTARGDYNACPFTLLQGYESKLKPVECVPHRSLVETSSIQVFEFLRNSITN